MCLVGQYGVGGLGTIKRMAWEDEEIKKPIIWGEKEVKRNLPALLRKRSLLGYEGGTGKSVGPASSPKPGLHDGTNATTIQGVRERVKPRQRGERKKIHLEFMKRIEKRVTLMVKIY